MPQSRRANLAHQMSDKEMNVWAQSQGFPSMRALKEVTALGSHLHHGGKLTRDWVDRMAEVYPAIPRATIDGYAKNIRTLSDLANVVGVPLEAAKEYVAAYSTDSIANAVSQRMDARPSGDWRNPRTEVTHKEDAGSVRNTLKRQVPKAPVEEFNDAPAHVRRGALANLLEQQIKRTRDASTHYERVRGTDKYATEKGLRDDIGRAFDSSMIESAAENELSTADIEGVMQHEEAAQEQED